MIDFWVSIGSTYSYLSVMRLRVVEEESGVAFRWRPFSVRAIMIEQKTFPSGASPSSWRTCGGTSSGERDRAASSRDCLRRIRSRNSISPIARSLQWDCQS